VIQVATGWQAIRRAGLVLVSEGCLLLCGCVGGVVLEPSAVVMVLSVMDQLTALAIVPAVFDLDVEVVDCEVDQQGVGVGADEKGAFSAGGLNVRDLDIFEVGQTLRDEDGGDEGDPVRGHSLAVGAGDRAT
jgi:hypothetical protein